MASGDKQIVNFRLPDEEIDRLSRVAFELDLTKTALFRACLVLALPQIQANPYLVDIVTRDHKDNL